MQFDTIQRKLEKYHGEKIFHRGFKRAVVAVLLLPDGNGVGKILFIKRAEDPHDPWSGHMAFPGGKVDISDNGLLDAIYREVYEEIGIHLPEKSKFITRLKEIRAISKGKLMPLIITPFVFSLDSKPELICNREVIETVWIPITFFLNNTSNSTIPYKFKGINLSLPSFKYEDKVIWGLTYRMLKNLLNVISQPV